MLRFETLTLEGFGSMIGPEEFHFKDNGLTLIKGLNGAGKTTMISGLTWVAYGNMLKDKAKPLTWEHVRPPGYKGVKASLKFNNGYHEVIIIRCENYTGKVEGSKGGKRLILKVDGEIQKQYPDKIATQKAINKLIGMSYDLFINSIVFGQKMKRIIESTGPKQKGIFDEAFEVTYVNEAKNAVDVDYKRTRDDHASLNLELSKVNHDINSTKELYQNSLDSERRFQDIKDESVDKLLKELLDKKAVISKLNKEIKADKKQLSKKEKTLSKWDNDLWESIDDKYQVSKSSIVLHNTKILQTSNEIKELAEDILKHPTNCDKCGAVLDKKKRTKILRDLKSKRNKLKIKLGKLKTELIGLEKERDINKIELDKANKRKSKFDKVKSDKRFIGNKLENNTLRLGQLKKEIRLLKCNLAEEKNKELIIKSTDYKNRLKELRLKRKPIRLALEKNKKELDLLEWLIKEPLSNSGLKTYIFNSMLGAVNMELNKYATILGFEVEFAINLDSKRKEFYSLVAKDGHIVPFNDLSGGQQQLVNIAIAFAIHAVVNKGNEVNILIMDEAFESLDTVNIDIVNELIQMKAQTKAIYLITHQKDFNPHNCSTMYFELTKSGTSRVV